MFLLVLFIIIFNEHRLMWFYFFNSGSFASNFWKMIKMQF